MKHNPAISTSMLLSYYSFDLGDFTLEQTVQKWLLSYPPKWVLAAVVEALYQGRYKAASVERILLLWRIRGQQVSHFDGEFADLVCRILLKRVRLYSGMAKAQIKHPRMRANLAPINMMATCG